MGERIAAEYQRIFQRDRPRAMRNLSDEPPLILPHFSLKQAFFLSLSLNLSDDLEKVRKMENGEYQGVTEDSFWASSTHTGCTS
jgi:hypothetical protein